METSGGGSDGGGDDGGGDGGGDDGGGDGGGDSGGDDNNIKESNIGTRDKGDEIQDTQDTNDIKDNSAHNDNTNEDHNNNNKAQGGKLTIHLELKYKTWQKTDPQRLGKFTLVVYSEDHNSKKIWKKDIYLDKLPKSYDVKKLVYTSGRPCTNMSIILRT